MVVTVSSSFCAGGAVVAARVAERLGWPVHNRAIPAEVAERLAVELDTAFLHDESVETAFSRLMSNLASHLTLEPGVALPDHMSHDPKAFKLASEHVIRAIAEHDAVIVGRAAAVVLADRQDALHVRFDGPVAARLARARIIFGLSEKMASQRLLETDRARALYVRTYYKRDWNDPSLYHLIIDGTAFDEDACAEIVLAAVLRRGPNRATPRVTQS